MIYLLFYVNTSVGGVYHTYEGEREGCADINWKQFEAGSKTKIGLNKEAINKPKRLRSRDMTSDLIAHNLIEQNCTMAMHLWRPWTTVPSQIRS